MNKTEFWNSIEKVRIQPNNRREQDSLIKEVLSQLELEEIVSFFQIYSYYHYWANRTELWNAAILINGGCSNDGFIDFRDWLILQGKEIYYKAIDDPDTLIEIAPFGEARADLGGFINEVHNGKTGIFHIPYPDLDEVEVPPIDGSKLNEKVAMQALPKLGAKSQEIYDWNEDSGFEPGSVEDRIAQGEQISAAEISARIEELTNSNEGSVAYKLHRAFAAGWLKSQLNPKKKR